MEAPVILNLKRGPIGRPQKRPTKDLSKVFPEKVNPKASREGRPHREDPKRSTKVLFKAVLRKRPAKELEANGGPWLEPLWSSNQIEPLL